MRLFVSGSAPLLIETFNDWRERTGHTILERYGMSETVMLTSNPYRPESARRGGTVGLPLPGVGVRVHDDKGRPLPAGEIGDIEVKGPNVFKGYWRMPEKTADEFTTDLWFKTGDVGRIDADGYVTIVGRSKDLIISGGYNVYPAEIEGVHQRTAGRGRVGGGRRAAPRLRRSRGGRGRAAGPAPRSTARRSRRSCARRSPTSRCPSRCSWCPSCRATPWARCRRTCCATQHRGLFVAR